VGQPLTQLGTRERLAPQCIEPKRRVLRANRTPFPKSVPPRRPTHLSGGGGCRRGVWGEAAGEGARATRSVVFRLREGLRKRRFSREEDSHRQTAGEGTVPSPAGKGYGKPRADLFALLEHIGQLRPGGVKEAPRVAKPCL